MSTFRFTLRTLVFFSVAILWHPAPQANAQSPEGRTPESPASVVAHWLELHRTGERDKRIVIELTMQSRLDRIEFRFGLSIPT